MPININKFFSKKSLSRFTAIFGKLPNIAVTADSIGIFYE